MATNGKISRSSRCTEASVVNQSVIASRPKYIQAAFIAPMPKARPIVTRERILAGSIRPAPM